MRLRNLFLAVLLFLCLLVSVPSYSAWLFDGTNDYVTLADNSALNLPDGDWTIAGWVKLTSNTGTGIQRFLNSWDLASNPYFEVLIYEDTWAETALRGDMSYFMGDNDGTEINASTTGTAPFTSNTNWTSVLVQRSGNTITQYINGSANGADTDAGFDAMATGAAWVFGIYDDLSSQPLAGELAEWAKWDRALTTGEINALSQGFSPACLSGFTWLTPMLGGVYQELRSGISVTNNGSTSAAHPRLYSCN